MLVLLPLLVQFVVWVINRLFTRMKKPPRLRFKLLLKNLSAPPAVGVGLALVPVAVLCMFIYLWWITPTSSDPVLSPNAVSFEGTAGDWQDQTTLDKTRVAKYKMGRVGMSLLISGCYLLARGAALLVPDTINPRHEDNAFKEMVVSADADPFSVKADDDEEGEENEFWDPVLWKRANLLLVTLVFMAVMLVAWEFSYSSLFTANIYGFLVLIKVARNTLEPLLDAYLHEKLLVLPLLLVLAASEDLIAMGSADFLGFTLFYFCNLSFLMLERLYFAPAVRHWVAIWPKWKLAFRRKFILKKRKRRTREQKARDEAAWRRVCDRVDHHEAGVEAAMEAIGGQTIVIAELFLAPAMLAFQVVFSAATHMPALYGVKQTDLLYYALFALFIIPSNLILGALQVHTLELAHGWKLYEYLSYQRHKFATRDDAWPLRARARAPDESLHPAFQSLDLLCFSSQLYFIITLYALGVLLALFGVSTCLRAEYSVFGEPIALLIIAVVLAACRALDELCLRLGTRLRVWTPPKMLSQDAALDDELAAKLALGAGRQPDLERERLELQALNSERFRHRFLDRNRPWVLQHLVELLTPRTLAAPMGLGAGDERPASEFVRDIYHELMQMGEGRRLHGDRSDISSDDEDELEKMRRQWSSVPVEGASRDLALYWLTRARKRRAFAKLVGGIVAGGKQPACERCGREEKTADEGKAGVACSLSVDLATSTLPPADREGEREPRHDPVALDRLIDGFEAAFGPKETDADLWKAFFRKTSVLLTLCDVCCAQDAGRTRQRGDMAKRAQQAANARRALRGDDFSSDDDENETSQAFAPVIVARGAVEGRVLSKWLLAARRRLGGVFPRPDAQQQMEAYAKRMRKRQARSDKRVHVDSDEENERKWAEQLWRLEMNESSRAIALKWLWQARDVRDAAFRSQSVALRARLDGLVAKMLEADDWFFGRELRLMGAQLVDEARALAGEQQQRDGDAERQIAQTLRDAEAFESDKRAASQAEQAAFERILATEREQHAQQLEAREREMLEAFRQQQQEQLQALKDVANDAERRQQQEQQRAVLARMEQERERELAAMRTAFADRAQQKRDAFERKLVLVENAVQGRHALAQHRVLALRKEAMQAVRARETNWQARAAGWMDKAARKVAVREQEELEAQANDRKRRKRVLLRADE